MPCGSRVPLLMNLFLGVLGQYETCDTKMQYDKHDKTINEIIVIFVRNKLLL